MYHEKIFLINEDIYQSNNRTMELETNYIPVCVSSVKKISKIQEYISENGKT